MRYTKMKNIYEVSSILENMDDATFDHINNDLLDAYWFSGCSAEAEKALAEGIAPYDLTVEEIVMWDAE